MGREWYCRKSFRRSENESAGCVSGLLQFFDFHQLQFPTQQQQPQASKTESFQGIEAPRNSLELDLDSTVSSTSVIFEEDVPIGIQLHSRLPTTVEKDSSSDISSFEGSKTPNLVARLMGLDLLPDQVSSPPMRSRQSRRTRVQRRRDTILSINETTRYETGIRSLPNTPRTSSSRRSDVDVERRLSLQLNKENIDMTEFSYFSRSFSKDAISASSPFSSRKIGRKEGRLNDENKSPSSYAREIVKQVKENVSRRVGMDITNISCRNRSGNESTRISHQSSVKKTMRISRASEESKQSKPSTPSSSSSPRLRLSECKTQRIENKDPISNSSKPSPLSSTSTSLPLTKPKESAKTMPNPLPKSTTKCRKANCEKFTSQTTRKKCTTTLSNTLLVQIHPLSNSIETPQQQTAVSQLFPSASSQQQKRDDRFRTTVIYSAELRYVEGILDRTGIEGNSTVSFTRWFSPAHPINPTVFHNLETSFHPTVWGPLKHRCNRRLLFDLVDEILQIYLGPQLRLKPWLERRSSPLKRRTGEELLELLLLKVRSFSLAKCETLQDIDRLVELDMAEANVREGGYCYAGVAEEGESIVFEMEREILESLVREALLVMVIP